jgi:CubicO group peptidase (beta-lactamase class C family)
MSLSLLLVLVASSAAGEPLAASPDTTPRAPLALSAPRSAPSAVPTPRHELASASAAGLSFASLVRAEEAVYQEVRRGGFPGAALAVGRGSQVVLEQGIGRTGWTAGDLRVDADETIYDLASLTKVVATTTAAMLLVEDGKLSLDAPVSRYLPHFVGPGKAGVRVRHLLAHTSGLPAWAELYSTTPQGSLARAIATPLQREPGVRAEYSDIGFVLLWAVAEQAAGEPLYKLLDRRVFGPLAMRSTTYLPGAACERCAPTALLPDGTLLRGVVHDPIARRLGGVTGNAGLFSTAHDLARFAAMLAGEGEMEGVRVLKAETIRRFTARQPGAGTRALGWDTPAAGGKGAGGSRLSGRAFGHTGFTGTSLWVDPERGTWTVLLSNRTFQPRGENRIQAVRRTVNDWVCDSSDRARLAGPAPLLSAP